LGWRPRWLVCQIKIAKSTESLDLGIILSEYPTSLSNFRIKQVTNLNEYYEGRFRIIAV